MRAPGLEPKGHAMATGAESERLTGILRRAMVALVHREGPDLTARQFAVFLCCYLDDRAQTVRGLSQALGISKPAVSRALDRLGEFDLVVRAVDEADRRSILARRTPTGAGFMREIRAILRAAEAAAAEQPERAPPGRKRKAAAPPPG